MLKKYKNILYTLREKLKEDETRTLILDECLGEIDKIIENELVCKEFAIAIQADIARYNEHRQELLINRQKFECLALNEKQKKEKVGPSIICSYKYKKKGNNNKNIRCIYITDEENKWNIFLKCFIEKSNKGKRGDYKVAIDEAIKRYNEIYEEG